MDESTSLFAAWKGKADFTQAKGKGERKNSYSAMIGLIMMTTSRILIVPSSLISAASN